MQPPALDTKLHSPTLNSSIPTSSASNTSKKPRNTASLLDRILAPQSEQFDTARSTIDTRPPRIRPATMNQIHRTMDGGPLLKQTGLGIAMGDGYGSIEELQQAGPASHTFVPLGQHTSRYPPPQQFEMNGQQRFQPQYYAQQTFYPDSMQEQPHSFYFQSNAPMQRSYSNHPSIPEGQEQMFGYACAPQQSTFLPPNVVCDNGVMVVHAGQGFVVDHLEGTVTPPVAADPSAMMGNGTVFFGMAPAMTISPSSLHSSDVEHSSSLSEVDAFVSLQVDQGKDINNKKRRMTSEDGSQQEISRVGPAADQSLDASSPKSRKRSRKVKTEEQTGTPPLVSCSTLATQDSPATSSAEDSKAAVMVTLRKHHGAAGKKKNPPPGGFKPWNTSPASSHLPSGSECINPITGEVSLPNLENLTKEEIRKVKNRASAQRSRTRKTEQTYELRVENTKLMERIEVLKKALNDARPDLCASLALDKPEPTLLAADSMRYDGQFHDDEEKQHMQMLITGLRSQLDAERNQRVAAEQKISTLELQLETLASASISACPVPGTVAIPSKLTLDQVAERENAVHDSFSIRTLRRIDTDDEVLRSVSTTPVFHQTPVMGFAGASRFDQPLGFANVIPVKTELNECCTGHALSHTEDKCGLMFVMLVSMALFALPLAMRESRPDEGTATLATQTGDLLESIQQSVVPPGMAKRTIAVTVLKPVTESDDSTQLCGGLDSLSEVNSKAELNQAVQSWLSPAPSADAQRVSQGAFRGWIVVKGETASSTPQVGFNLWSGPTSASLDSKWFAANDLSDSLGPANPDSSAFPSFFTPESALWQKGPSPTLAPLIVEDPFADIADTTDLSDLQTGTRSSTIFDDQVSSFLGSRRTSIHSAWHSDALSMTRSASAASTSPTIAALDDTSATKFVKFDIEVEISTEITFHGARNKSVRPEFLDRAVAAKLLETGDVFPQ